MRAKILPADNQLLRLVDSIRRREPDLSILDIRDRSAWRNLWGMAGVHTLGLAAVPGDGPNRLLSSCRITGGIRHLADCVLAFTAHIDNRVGVRGKTEVQELLAVILAVFCELPCRECGPFGHPDVAPAFLIQNPSDAVGILCRNQAGGKRRAHYLFERERFLRVRARRQNQQSHCTAQGVTRHRSLPPGLKNIFIQESRSLVRRLAYTRFLHGNFWTIEGP